MEYTLCASLMGMHMSSRTTAVQVRLPTNLVSDIDWYVEKHYGTRSEFIREAARARILALENDPLVKEVREIRRRMEQDYLKRAGGDEDKMIELMAAEHSKIHNETMARLEARKRNYVSQSRNKK